MKYLPVVLVLSSVAVLSSCGGGSEGDSSSPSMSEVKSLVVTAVDPYISEAQFCIDVNKNGQCDAATDKFSTADTVVGQYVFSGYVPTEDLAILPVTNGKHNGKAYTLGLKGKVGANVQTAVVNPATTAVFSQKISNTELVTILNQFSSQLGMTVSEADLLVDPASGLLDKSPADVTDAELAKLRLQVVLYALQRIMQGSTIINGLEGSQFVASATAGSGDGDGNDVIYKIIEAMITSVTSGINKSVISAFLADSGYQTAIGYGAPKFNMADLLATAVTVVDKATEVGYSACNASSGDINAITAAITPLNAQIITWAGTLDRNYYATNHKAGIESVPYAGSQIMTEMRKDTALNAGFNCASKYFEIDASNAIQCIN